MAPVAGALMRGAGSATLSRLAERIRQVFADSHARRGGAVADALRGQPDHRRQRTGATHPDRLSAMMSVSAVTCAGSSFRQGM